MRKTCFLCGCEITDRNDSEEHVIPQAIGGKLSVWGFICKSCNDRTGRKWDSVLTQQLNPLSLFFGIVRERGEVPSQTVSLTTGERLEQHADGTFSPQKPLCEEKKMERGIEIKITARSDEELETILKGIKKKYPQVDINELKQRVIRKKEYPQGLIKYEISFGGKEAGRSVVKTALSFAHSLGMPISECPIAVQYLKEDKGEAPFGYYSQDIITNRPAGIPLHCVAVLGNPEQRLLLAYVEYFGFRRMIVCLSDQYGGEIISKAYAIDPMIGEEIDVNISLNLRSFKIRDLYDGKMCLHELTQKACSDVIGPRFKATHDAERKKIIEEAINSAIKNSGCQEGESFAEEHINKMAQDIAQKMLPYILHMRGIKRRE